MKFTLLSNIIDYFRKSTCVRTFIYTTLGLMIFGSILFLISYFFKQNKKMISVMLFFVLIALIFLINFMYDMGKTRVNAPKISSPKPIQKPKVEEEKTEDVLEEEPQPGNMETENFASY